MKTKMTRIIPSTLRQWFQRAGLHPRGKGRGTSLVAWPRHGKAIIEVTGDFLRLWPEGRSTFGGEWTAEVRIPATESELRAALITLQVRHGTFQGAIRLWNEHKGYRPRPPYADENMFVCLRPDLIDAAMEGNLPAIRAASPDLVDIHRTDDGYGFNALGWALYHSHVECAAAILDRFQIDLNRAPAAQYGGTVATALHLACQPHRYAIDARLREIHGEREFSAEEIRAFVEERHLPLIERLIALGADVHHRCTVGHTAYSRAVGSGFDRIADLLEQHGCGPDDASRTREFGQFMESVRDMAEIEHLQALAKRGFALPSKEQFESHAAAVGGYEEERAYCDAVRAAFAFAA